MSADVRPALAAAALLAVFAALDARVSNRPLVRLDAQAVYFRGQLTPLALLFTRSGRARPLTVACIFAIAVYAALGLSIAVPAIMTASQLLSQMAVEYCKTLFKRVRPDYWLVGPEVGHSYPSGHAATAVVFFIGWAVIAANSNLPYAVKGALVTALALWAAGIMWSRLALGAHYLSDVTGGVLFGTAWLAAVFIASSHFYALLR